MIRNYIIILLLFLNFSSCKGEKPQDAEKIVVGAEQPEKYLNLLANKNVAIMVNQTSMVDSVHLVDFLISKDIHIEKIFAVEHGFRGNAANGEKFDNSIDTKTGIPIISLYGKNKKPTKDNFSNIDIVIFDIQDVGCRFYTYISSMFYLMDACAENNIPLIVFDRPNPNGDYIAGAVLDMKLQSFVGMLPIPIVHGCTVGELAKMINGEGWLTDNSQCDLTVIPVKSYTHETKYNLPISPSPNLPNDLSIRLYPSLCFFEATNVSIGRGTYFPFQVIGYPNSPIGLFEFTTKTITGTSLNPLHENEICKGIDLRNSDINQQFTLSYFIQFFESFSKSEDFWKSEHWINLLSGDSSFYKMINQHKTEEEIIESWQPKLNEYQQMRKKYLFYPDFE